jgi:putative hydrolase of the HAD superfamily
MPGHRDILEVARKRGIKTGLLTNGRTKTQNTKVDLLGIRPLLDCIIISEATGYKKPAPEIFQIALEEAGTEAHETWFVGDHPINDVKGATSVGITGIWMSGSHEWPADEPPPTFEIDSLDQLELLIDITERS